MDGPPVFVITGQLAAGKTTLARALLERFPLGHHVELDTLREMVVSGLAGPLKWSDETTRQFDLAVRAGAALAGIYQPAGFAVAVEGAADPHRIRAALEETGLADQVVGVVLRPRLEVALVRNAGRGTKAFDTRVLTGAMHRLDDDLAAPDLPPGWTALDTDGQSLEESVEAVLALSRR